MANLEAKFQRASTLYRAGDLAEAIAAFKSLLKKAPKNSGTLYMLSLAEFKAGQSESAFRHLSRAIELSPRSAEYTNTMGVFLDNLGRTPEAVVWYRKTLVLDPDKALTLTNLGFALRRTGQYKEAFAVYQQVSAKDPNNHAAIKGAGDVMADARNPSQAMHCFAAALKLRPDYVDALISLGALQMGIGSIEEAEQTFRRIIALNPACMPAHCDLSDCVKTEKEDPRFGVLEEFKTRGNLPQSDQVKLHFALGKMYRDTGNTSEAFRNYRLGNETRKKTKGWGYSFEADKARCDALCTVYTKEFFQQRATYGVVAESPVFVVGMPRSGTTLVEQIIASHPLGHGGGELPFMNALSCQTLENVSLERLSAKAEGISEEQVGTCVEQYLNATKRLAPEKTRVVDKMPHNFWNLWLIDLMFQKARVIHCKRNAMDTCLSCYFTDFEQAHGYKCDLQTLGRYYGLYQKLMTHWENVLRTSMLVVNYEELVQDPEGVSRQIISYCGLEWNEQCLRFYEGKRQVRTASSVQVRKKVYSTSVERWKRYEEYLGPLKEALGM